MIRHVFSLIIALAAATTLYAQSKTTSKLEEKYSDSFALFFYNNTLRMINMKEDKEFDELIRDIEKMKLLIVKKDSRGIDYKKLVTDYKSESFEEIMTSRHEGKSFDIFLKEKGGKTKGMLVLVNDTDNLFVLDIVGSIALDKVTKLYSVLDDSNDIGKKIKGFVHQEDEASKKETEREGDED